jgi:hypothetical protein
MQTELDAEIYPYIVPLPLGREERMRFLYAAFGSKVRLDILSAIIEKGLEQRSYEKSLIERLPYSNKTMIKHLNIMVEDGILFEGMERVESRERSVWMKWFQLTKPGRWIALLLSGPGELPDNRIKETFEETLEMVSSSRDRMAEKFS